MDAGTAHYQRGLALVAGMLDGVWRSVHALQATRRQDARSLSGTALETVLEYHQHILMYLQVMCEQMRVLPEAEDAQRVLGALIGSELTFIQAVLYRPQDAEQATADAMDDRRVWLLAFERLCRLAGLPEDPLDV